MDRAEAIKILEIQLDVTSVNTPSCIKLHEALELAIEALGDAESAMTADCISRADAIEQIDKWHDFYADSSLRTDKARRDELSAIKAMLINLPSLPPVNQKQITGKLETVENATSESEESTMGQPKSKLDCISRQQAIEALDRIGSLDTYTDREYARDIFDNLPPVTPTASTEKRVRIMGKCDTCIYYRFDDFHNVWVCVASFCVHERRK